MKEVYIIIVYDYEETEIEHVCLSKETAKKRFEEVKQELLKREIETYERFKKQNREVGMQNTQDKITFYNKLSFDNQHPVNEYTFAGYRPGWIKKELED